MTDKEQQIKRAIVDSMTTAMAGVGITGESLKTLNGEVWNKVIQEMTSSAMAVGSGVDTAATKGLIKSFADALNRSIDAPAATVMAAKASVPSSAHHTPVNCNRQDQEIIKLKTALASEQKEVKDLKDAALAAAAAALAAASAAGACTNPTCANARATAAGEQTRLQSDVRARDGNISLLQAQINAKDGEINQCKVNFLAEKAKVLALGGEKTALVAEKNALDGQLAALKIENQKLHARCADDKAVTDKNKDVQLLEAKYTVQGNLVSVKYDEVVAAMAESERKLTTGSDIDKDAAKAKAVEISYDLLKRPYATGSTPTAPAPFDSTALTGDNAAKMTAAQNAQTAAQEYLDEADKYILEADKFIAACQAVAAAKAAPTTTPPPDTNSDGLKTGADYYKFAIGESADDSKNHAPKMLKLLQDVGAYLKDPTRNARHMEWEKKLPTEYPLAVADYPSAKLPVVARFGTGIKTLTDIDDTALALNSDPPPGNISGDKMKYEPSVKVWNMINFMKYLKLATANDEVIKIKNLWYVNEVGDELKFRGANAGTLKTSHWWGSAAKVDNFINFLRSYENMTKIDPPNDLVDGKYLYDNIAKNDTTGQPTPVFLARKAWCAMREQPENNAEMFRLYLL